MLVSSFFSIVGLVVLYLRFFEVCVREVYSWFIYEVYSYVSDGGGVVRIRGYLFW